MTYEVKAKTRPLARIADTRRGQPDGWHQVAACELGEHVGIDTVGLGGERRQALDLGRVSDGDLSALLLEGVVTRSARRSST